MYEGLINNLCKAADKWEKEHPIIGVGQLRVHDALRDAARALKEADSKLEQVTLERDAAVQDIRKLGDIGANICPICVNCNGREVLRKCSTCGYDVKNGNFEWRGVMKEDTNDQ